MDEGKPMSITAFACTATCRCDLAYLEKAICALCQNASEGHDSAEHP